MESVHLDVCKRIAALHHPKSELLFIISTIARDSARIVG